MHSYVDLCPPLITVLLIIPAQDARKIDSGIIQEVLSLGQAANQTKEDCVWRTESDSCSRNSVKFTLYTRVGASNGNEKENARRLYEDDARKKNYTTNELASRKCHRDDEGENLDQEQCEDKGNDKGNDKGIERMNVNSSEVNTDLPAWLHSSDWNPSHDTVILIHGYGGTADHLPVGILKDAYLRNGSYNVIVADWGPLAKIPCYIAAVHNIKIVARCVGQLHTFLRNSGVDMRRTSCVGHSLGAHVCGVAANFLPFRLSKIIGLDPAKPLIPNASKSKLDVADAEMVHVLHTSSNYGDSKKIGHVDFYFNGGRTQPFCVNATDEQLCSHLRSVCYMAESIFSSTIKYGTKCKRRNVVVEEDPKGIFNRIGNAHFLPVGQATPHGAIGTYCVSSVEAPFCSLSNVNFGSPFCCSPAVSSGSQISLS